MFCSSWKLLLFLLAFVSDSFTSIISPDWRCQSIASANFIVNELLYNTHETHAHKYKEKLLASLVWFSGWTSQIAWNKNKAKQIAIVVWNHSRYEENRCHHSTKFRRYVCERACADAPYAYFLYCMRDIFYLKFPIN